MLRSRQRIAVTKSPFPDKSGCIGGRLMVMWRDEHQPDAGCGAGEDAHRVLWSHPRSREARYPAASITAIRLDSAAVPFTIATPSSRSTTAVFTPGTRRSLRSTARAQLPHVIPVTASVVGFSVGFSASKSMADPYTFRSTGVIVELPPTGRSLMPSAAARCGCRVSAPSNLADRFSWHPHRRPSRR